MVNRQDEDEEDTTSVAALSAYLGEVSSERRTRATPALGRSLALLTE